VPHPQPGKTHYNNVLKKSVQSFKIAARNPYFL